ncbi:MAG: sensor histidine kinase [Spirochaetaceae bacterium]|nr:MAG: sensor histidine kinase [Spirochaetaceae bacterium]
MRRPGLATWLFLSYAVVLSVAVIVFFLTTEAATPAFMVHHRGHAMHQMHPGGDTPGPMVDELEAVYGRATRQALIVAGIAAFLTAAGVSFLFSRRITNALRRMRSASERIAAGRYDERLPGPAPGEVGDLVAAFNRMAGELATTEQRRSALIGNVAHEFRTPLSSLRGYIEGFQDGLIRPDAPTLESCSRQIARLSRLVDDLSLLSRVDAGIETIEPRPCDVNEVVRSTERTFQPAFEEKGLSLSVTVSSIDRPVLIDPVRTAQALDNIVSNALRHTPKGGCVTVSTRPGPTHVVIDVSDTGSGIPAAVLPRVFERFFSADRSMSGGAGIGLTIARMFVEGQNGTISIESTEGSGTRVTMTLPYAG